MPAKLKIRGDVFHIEGTVRVGKTSVRIRETTGCREANAAQRLLNQRLAEIERRILLGESLSDARHTIPDFATAAADYIDASPHLGRQDRSKLLRLGEFFDDMPADQIGSEAWDKFVAVELAQCAPATIRRWFAMFSAPMRRASDKHCFSLPKFALPKEGKGRENFLELEDRDKLLACYPSHANSIATMLCFQGCRHFEALRLRWSDVSFDRNTLTFKATKNGDSRVVPMHPRVRALLHQMHHIRNTGPVFVTRAGKPYVDRRQASHGAGRDGSGIRSAHAIACEKAGINGFRIHDWRHHWASWFIMDGGDPPSLLVLGGWKTPKMVQRYVKLSVGHLSKQLERSQSQAA